MLRRKSLLIWLAAVTFCFVGIASANAVGGSAGSYDSYDDAYFVIDCYLGSNGDAWILWWDCLDGTAGWEIVAATAGRYDVNENTEKGGGGGTTSRRR